MATVYVLCVFFFFFQAEDGIRDVAVTGVQTCAFPISSWSNAADSKALCPAPMTTTLFSAKRPRSQWSQEWEANSRGTCLNSSGLLAKGSTPAAIIKIGRASCRERGVDLGGRRIIKKKKK